MAIARLIVMLFRTSVMKQATLNLIAIGFGSLLIAACAGDKSQYPSLAIRDVERSGGVIDTGPPVEPVPLNITAIIPESSIAQLVEQARVSHGNFLARAPSVRRLAAGARGTGRDSEARGRAIVALADLTSLRRAANPPKMRLQRMRKFSNSSTSKTGRSTISGECSADEPSMRNLPGQRQRGLFGS